MDRGRARQKKQTRWMISYRNAGRTSPSRIKMTRKGHAITLACLLLWFSLTLLAQTSFDDSRPLDDWIELPDFPASPAQPGTILPPILPAQPDTEAELYSGQRFLLRAVRYSGNLVISTEALNDIVAPAFNTTIDLSELQALRDAITRHYVNRGYINSGARIPDQQIDNGEVHIEIIEGKLNRVDVDVEGGFNADYFSSRLLYAAEPVLNLKSLEQRLVMLQQDPRFDRIDAALAPGERPGEAVLSLQVETADAISQGIEMNNHHAPVIGAEGLYYHWRHGNLGGNGEVLFIGLEKTEGMDAVDLLFETPLNARDDSLSFFARGNESDVIDDEFTVLGIESRSHTLGVSLRRPISRNPEKFHDWLLSFEQRRSESFLLGEGFSFSPGPEDGVARISALRTGPDLQWRSPQRVLAARVTLSIGLDVFDATIHDDARPDAEFISLLLQGQWAQRVNLMKSTVIARIDMQFSDSPLLGLEQFAIGGHNTVRGYRENTLVRDQGAVASVEWRIPYVTADTAQHDVTVFADVGYSENRDRDTTGPTTLNSIGLGLVGQFTRRLSYQIYWAEALKELQPLGEEDLQDDGVHVRVGYGW